MTPKEVQRLSEPIEKVYADIVDELLINIGKHLTGNTTTWTAYWEVQKLAEVGQLTAENAAIINKYIEDMPQHLKDTMEETRQQALAKLEIQLAKAAQDGYLTPPVSDTTVNVLRDYGDQAAEKLNLTNTVMLESSVEAYKKAVKMTEERAQELEQEAQAIVGAETGMVATGAITRRQALQETVQKVSDAGLTGFVDHAGRNWTPEAYVNMVVRTTCHNVAVQSIKARMTDYDTDVFQVSSHAAARPLCYPYQGKFYSWYSSGEITLGNGKTVRYQNINETSYGEPAGLFGINCGHFPIPVIPGVTIPHGADNIQPQEKNDKEYAESQVQRALERDVRAAKRVVEMAGDTVTKEQKQAVRDAQAKIRDFTESTGRARRYDREGIVKTKG